MVIAFSNGAAIANLALVNTTFAASRSNPCGTVATASVRLPGGLETRAAFDGGLCILGPRSRLAVAPDATGPQAASEDGRWWIGVMRLGEQAPTAPTGAGLRLFTVEGSILRVWLPPPGRRDGLSPFRADRRIHPDDLERGAEMPLMFSISLVVTIVLVLVSRAVVPGLPLRTRARAASPADLTILTLGVVGLLLHCGAMFFRDVVAGLPATAGYIATVTGPGIGGVALFVAPSLAVLIGLRGQLRVPVALLAAALLAVGVTMYGAFPLAAHLAAIFAGSALVALIVALLVSRPTGRRRSAPGEA